MLSSRGWRLVPGHGDEHHDMICTDTRKQSWATIIRGNRDQLCNDDDDDDGHGDDLLVLSS